MESYPLPMTFWKMEWNPTSSRVTKPDNWPLATSLISYHASPLTFLLLQNLPHCCSESKFNAFPSQDLFCFLFLFILAFYSTWNLLSQIFVWHTVDCLNVTSSKSSCPKISPNPSHNFSRPPYPALSVFTAFIAIWK